MKFSIATKILTIAALFALGPLQLLAQNAGLEIYAPDSTKFHLVLNGDAVNEVPQHYIKNNQLEAVRYKVKVVFDDENAQELSSNIILPEGKMTTYRLKLKSTDEAGKRTYGISLFAEVSMVGFAATTEQPAETVHVGQADNASLEVSSTLGESQLDTAMFDSTAMANYTGKMGCSSPLASTPFDAILHNVGTKMFESDKLDDAKQRIKNSCLTVAQVREIMKYFEFEDNKLDFAKYAYSYTFDIGNYPTLVNDFFFSSSKSELKRFLKANQ